MEVPDVTEIGWYLHGAVPGHEGATVLVAHVWWGDTAGPFHRLGALDPGAPIEVRLGDGTLHNYTVAERAIYDKDALPSDLWRNSGPETLVLITCGGEFNRSSNRYNQNIVVYALPTGSALDGLSGSGHAL
jgi:sortase (surface protein transpeptidase)